MKVGSIGFHYVHDRDFLFDSPQGPGARLLLIIKSSALVTLSGRTCMAEENSFLLIDRTTPCSYRAYEDLYIDDWIFLDCPDEETAVFEELGIPFDTVLPIGNPDEFSQLIHLMTYEHYSAEGFHEEAEQHYLRLLLIKLSRRINQGRTANNGAFMEKNSLLSMIRSRIYTDPGSIGPIDSLARECSLSRSGFQHAYKKMFGISVMTDIVNGRMELAKRLLTSTPMTVESIAAKCGYSSAYSFMRQFKLTLGMTPTQYRRGQDK